MARKALIVKSKSNQNSRLEDIIGVSFVEDPGRIIENFKYVGYVLGVLPRKGKYLE